jgi:DNA invertase Pin-like site-specific DNA recombinase
MVRGYRGRDKRRHRGLSWWPRGSTEGIFKHALKSLQDAIDTTTAGGMLIFHIMAALAEFERALIRERTQAGLNAARARGRQGGRPRKFTREQERQIALAMSNRATTMAEIRSLFKASDTTLRRIAAKHKQVDGDPT